MAHDGSSSWIVCRTPGPPKSNSVRLSEALSSHPYPPGGLLASHACADATQARHQMRCGGQIVGLILPVRNSPRDSAKCPMTVAISPPRLPGGNNELKSQALNMARNSALNFNQTVIVVNFNRASECPVLRSITRTIETGAVWQQEVSYIKKKTSYHLPNTVAPCFRFPKGG